MKLSRQDKDNLDHALYQAWASVGSICLEHGIEEQDSEYHPTTPTEEQFERILDQLFQSLTPDLCLYVINMKEEEFTAIIQSYTIQDWTQHQPATNAPPAVPLTTRPFKKAV